MRKIILAIAFVGVCNFGYSQNVDEAFKKDVLKVIERSGSAGQMSAAKKQILGMIPQEKQAAFLVEFDALMPKVYESMSKVYMEIYTKEDIKAMLAFYESPVGKKMNEKSAEISEKSMEATKELSGEIQTLVMKYMQ
ncbi:DUF2059 domain-containing protein [Flavobacterium sp. SUN046]|uniref:DUF2059 domain-containing protein n=1 Tax=Flavobacterium sp. SUN046 TaxID=3002440 RepID=UPI002DB56EBE|nr:DUF2059 domain-containing protein [Flavobacterium sp. SUN046]MEC4049260.1 DUF2059 domain-containing protein [Flavobacterium sp. SUN046]